jgi:hypothetical protein
MHALYYDKFAKNIWYLTGDNDNQCMIGYTDDKFKNIDIIHRGDQQSRAVKM